MRALDEDTRVIYVSLDLLLRHFLLQYGDTYVILTVTVARSPSGTLATSIPMRKRTALNQ